MNNGLDLRIPEMRLPEFKMPRIASASESFHGAIIEKIRLLEHSLTDEQALSVVCFTRIGEAIVVARLQFTDSAVVLVHGWDQNEQRTFLMSSVYSLELVCKVVKKSPDEKKKDPIGFDFPRENAEPQSSK
jgi:hypothetical protein